MTGISIVTAGIAIGVTVWIMRKKPASVAIIGGADGPTSIFLAGKIGQKNR